MGEPAQQEPAGSMSSDDPVAEDGSLSDTSFSVMSQDEPRSSRANWSALRNFLKKNTDPRRLRNKFDLPETEELIEDYSCAIKNKILLHGRMYIWTNFLTFHSNIVGYETAVVIPLKDVTNLRPRRVALFIPNAIEVVAGTQTYFFASFMFRDEAHALLKSLCTNLEDANSQRQTSPSLSEVSIDDTAEAGVELNTQDADSATDLFNKLDDGSMELLLSEELHTPFVDTFKLLFSDAAHDFEKQYHQERGDKDVLISKWSEHPTLQTVRVLKFRSPVNAPIGPKSTRVHTTQIYREPSSEKWCVETVSLLEDIPYGDHFFVGMRYEISKLSEATCSVHVYCGVVFQKSTWLKGQIEKNTRKESKQATEIWIRRAKGLLGEDGSESGQYRERQRSGHRRSSSTDVQGQDKNENEWNIVQCALFFLNLAFVLGILITLISVSSRLTWSSVEGPGHGQHSEVSLSHSMKGLEEWIPEREQIEILASISHLDGLEDRLAIVNRRIRDVWGELQTWKGHVFTLAKSQSKSPLDELLEERQ